MLNRDFTTAYTAVDVETPNQYNRSICSIGVVHAEPGAEPICRHYLVNPEDGFDEVNIGIHGITPSDVKNAPSLPEMWEQLGLWFSKGILIAHNATFDLSVIQKALERYELPVPDMYYVCTLKKARKHISKETFGSHRLNVLCDGLGIPLEHHHNALDDALACAALFEYLKAHFGCDESDVQPFRTALQPKRHDSDPDAEKALNTLQGLLLGVGFDRKILPLENTVLSAWLEDHRYSANRDIQACRRQLQTALEDGIITQTEYECLLELSKAVVACKAQYCITTQATQLLLGIVDGISCDGIINDVEAEQLWSWMEAYNYLRGFYPYDKIFDTLKPMLVDHHIDAEEQSELLAIIDHILHPVSADISIQYDGCTFFGL